MKLLIGRKQNMTQVFDAQGKVTPVTAIVAEPMAIVQTKTIEKDGYEAIRFGYGVQKKQRINKAQQALGDFAGFREERGADAVIGSFTAGDTVQISGVTKGKGFQGVVKRHNFGGGRRTHGQKHSEREPGSIGGAGRAGGRVAKGMRMAGRMGGDRVTVKNLKVVEVRDNNVILISGAVPGRKGSLLEIRGQ